MAENLSAIKDGLKADVTATVADVRAAYFVFLTAGLYLAVTVGATTHQQLMDQPGVALPLLGVSLPIAGFAVVAPLLFLALHFNLLYQLRLLAPKVRRLDDAIDRLPAPEERRVERALLSSFPFVQVVAGRSEGAVLHHLLRFTVWLTVVWAPALILIEVLVLFLPYHSGGLTWWHRVLIFGDLTLLWILWPGCLWPRGGPQQGYWAWLGLGTLSAFLFFCLAFGTLPNGSLERAVLAAIPDGWEKEDESGRRMPWPTWRLLEHPGTPFARNLRLHEANFVPDKPPIAVMEAIGELEALMKYGRRRDLRGRDLRYADLTGADLRLADLRALPDAESVDGEGEEHRPSARPACLPGSTGSPARLDGTILRYARLDGALLNEARLAQAKLRGARFGGARLASACLQGADLTSADLRGADLTGANLADADVGGTDFTDAILVNADLTHVKNFTQEQADRACGDERTRIPLGLELRPCEPAAMGQVAGNDRRGG